MEPVIRQKMVSIARRGSVTIGIKLKRRRTEASTPVDALPQAPEVRLGRLA